MFKVNQKVWCTIYGAGVVKRIRQEIGVDYPVVVVFNRDDNEKVATYTAEGKYHDEGNVTLFPHPVEVVKSVTKSSINWSHEYAEGPRQSCSAEVIRTSRTSTPQTCESCGLRKLFTFVNLLNERVTA